MRYERGRDAQDGGANMKRKPRETGGVIYRHTHIHTGSTPAAVPPGHHTHGHIHPLPSPPLPSQAGGAGQRLWLWGSCDCLVWAEGPVRAKGAGQNQARKVPPAWASYGIFWPDHLQARAVSGPCPDNRHGKGHFGLQLCPPPRRRLESGAQLSSAGRWPRWEAPPPGPEPAPSASFEDIHGCPPLSCEKTARVQGEGSADAGRGERHRPSERTGAGPAVGSAPGAGPVLRGGVVGVVQAALRGEHALGLHHEHVVQVPHQHAQQRQERQAVAEASERAAHGEGQPVDQPAGRGKVSSLAVVRGGDRAARAVGAAGAPRRPARAVCLHAAGHAAGHAADAVGLAAPHRCEVTLPLPSLLFNF